MTRTLNNARYDPTSKLLQLTTLTQSQPSTGRRRLLRWGIWMASLFALSGLTVVGYQWWTRPRPTPPKEIFRGVIYTCFEMNEPECRGLVHIVKVDLAAPGIQLYLTPLDAEAVAHGYQYRIETAKSVLEREHLAVVVNGALFSSDSGIVPWSGDPARGVQTIVADRQVSHLDPLSFLLWFQSDLTPHLEFSNPPTDAVLREARWGIGGGAVPLWKGKVREEAANHNVDRRTAVGIDPSQRLLWLAVFENASSAAVARVLAQQGAQDGILLDGGHSTSMLVGPEAAHNQTGSKLGGWRPVATFLGIRAEPLR
jgi:hypothetical protein